MYRVSKFGGRPKPKDMDDAVDLLYMLTGFHSFDSLAAPARNTQQVTLLIQQLARGYLLK